MSTKVPFCGLPATPNTIEGFPEIRIPRYSCRKSNRRNFVGKVGFPLCRFQLFKPAAPSAEIRETTSLGPPRPNRPGRPRRQLVGRQAEVADIKPSPRMAGRPHRAIHLLRRRWTTTMAAITGTQCHHYPKRQRDDGRHDESRDLNARTFHLRLPENDRPARSCI